MNKLTATFTQYNWFIKLIGAALLIGLAIAMWVLDVERIIEAMVGVLIAVYAVIRLVPYVRSQRDDRIKTINIIEITINFLIAALFIVAAFIREESLSQVGLLGTNVFALLLALVLIARGMIHFYGLNQEVEKGDHVTFFFHVATIIIGTLILARGFEVADLVILLIIASLISSAYLGYESYGGYSNYRRRKQLEEAPEDSAQDEVPDGIKAPGKEKEKEQDRIVS